MRKLQKMGDGLQWMNESHSLRILLELRGDTLKRDDDYIRELMFKIEDHDDWIYTCALFLDSDARVQNEYYHLGFLRDEGFLEESGPDGGSFRMTNSGHDFLAAIRDEKRWKRTKKAANHLSGASLSVLKEIATGYVRPRID